MSQPSASRPDSDVPRSNGRKSTSGRSSGNQASSEANRRAAVILEVLGGVRTPSEAAAALKISVTHYYLLERKAMRGLQAACELPPKGTRVPTVEQELTALRRQLQKCRSECLRQTALVRATQRAVGLTGLPPVSRASSKKGANGSKKGRRRPTVRALRAAETMQKNSSGPHSPTEVEQSITQRATEPLSRTGPQELRGDAKG